MYGLKAYHPFVIFLYFALVIGFSMFLMHPICLCISLFSGICNATVFGASEAIRKNGLRVFLFFLLAAAINPLYSHAGVTVLFYLPSGNPLTLEATLYGLAAAAMLLSVSLHFYAYSLVMTSDKLLCLLGKRLPTLSLLFSMALRFLPRLSSKAREIAAARQSLGEETAQGLLPRIRSRLTILSVLTSWALESTSITADSMRARGYGLPGRSFYSIFTWRRHDSILLVLLLLFGLCTGIGIAGGPLTFSYYPQMSKLSSSRTAIILYLAYFLLCILPTLLYIQEEQKWNVIKSKTCTFPTPMQK